MAFLLAMKIVEKVIYPIITKTESVVGFHLNDIACQGNHYGIVTNITPESDRPITINWDDNEPFAYTKDELRFLKIKVVEQLLPQKTIVFMPTGATVLLENGEQTKFDSRQEFLVINKSDSSILIQSIKTKETYQFQLDCFPGKVFAHLIKPTTVFPGENLPFTQHELKYKAEIWLLLEFDSLLLNNLTSAIEQQLKQRWRTRLDKPFNSDETDAAWQIAFSQFLRIQAEKVGLYGLKIGTRILKQTSDNQLVFGYISDVNFYQCRFDLQWDDGEQLCLSFLEMKALSISTISLVFLSDNVAYEISSERELLKAYIGFRTKKLGQVWLRPLKKIIGKLSNLKDCRAEEYRHLPKKKWATMNPYKHRQSSKNLYLSLPPNTY